MSLTGKIYRISSPDDSLHYIGSTISKYLSTRYCQHRHSTNQSSSKLLFQQYGDAVKCHIIEEYPCESLRELRERERMWTEHPDYRGKCVNKNRAFVTKEESQLLTNARVCRWAKIKVAVPCGKTLSQMYHKKHRRSCKKCLDVSNISDAPADSGIVTGSDQLPNQP